MSLVKESIEIAAPSHTVWSILEDFGDVARWAPYMLRSELLGDQKTGIGTRRRLRHSWGYRIEERVTQWTDGRGFAFDVHRAPWPMKAVRETWAITESNGQTTVATTVEYGMGLSIIGSILNELLVRHIVRREMRAGLLGLKRHAEQQSTEPAAAPSFPH